jgi:hypothetical protein
MGRITIFNTISAVIVGAVGAALGACFGRDGLRWGLLIGGISGFVFPFYPIVLIAGIIGRTRRGRSVKESKKQSAEPGASPNGGPATRSGDSGVSGGPPSVS